VIEMVEKRSLEVGQYWIRAEHNVTYEVKEFSNEYDWDNDCMYRVAWLQNIVTKKWMGMAENIVEKYYVLDSFSQKKLLKVGA
jgi:hypothetical protein